MRVRGLDFAIERRDLALDGGSERDEPRVVETGERSQRSQISHGLRLCAKLDHKLAINLLLSTCKLHHSRDALTAHWAKGRPLTRASHRAVVADAAVAAFE